MRDAITLEEGKELELLGWNLANCFHQLKSDLSRERWQRMLDMGRLGLGPDLEEITTYASGRGLVELRLHFSTLAEPVYASNLSDGQLAYLALLALGELGREYPPSLLAIDEPTANLHPNLAVRVAWLLEELAAHSPVVVATHSDRFLDALSEPQASAVLCELDASRSTQLRRPDASYLAQWLEDYRGLGALRAAGYESIVFSAPGAKP